MKRWPDLYIWSDTHEDFERLLRVADSIAWLLKCDVILIEPMKGAA